MGSRVKLTARFEAMAIRWKKSF